jgi:hypothetical protein
MCGVLRPIIYIIRASYQETGVYIARRKHIQRSVSLSNPGPEAIHRNY